jgi:hypothetical protein
MAERAAWSDADGKVNEGVKAKASDTHYTQSQQNKHPDGNSGAVSAACSEAVGKAHQRAIKVVWHQMRKHQDMGREGTSSMTGRPACLQSAGKSNQGITECVRHPMQPAELDKGKPGTIIHKDMHDAAVVTLTECWLTECKMQTQHTVLGAAGECYELILSWLKCCAL